MALLSHRDLRDIFRVGTRAGQGGWGSESGSWLQVLRALGRSWVRLGHSDAHPLSPLSFREQRFGREVMVALYAPSEPVMDYNMVIIFIMAVGTVALGGYWAGSHDVKK